MDASNKQFKTIDEYISMFPEDVRTILNQVRQTIREAAPEAQETINYQMPTFTELSVYKGAKGSVQFPLDQPMPLSLIHRIVEYRVKENSGRKPGKKTSTKKEK